MELIGNDLNDFELGRLVICCAVKSKVRSPGFMPLNSISA
jgi:hypothetical protein